MLLKTPRGRDTALMRVLKNMLGVAMIPVIWGLALGVGAFIIWMPFNFLFWIGDNDVPFWLVVTLIGGFGFVMLSLISIVESNGEKRYRSEDDGEFTHTEDYNYDRFSDD